MKIENLEHAVHYKERREKLLEIKRYIESHTTNTWITIGGTSRTAENIDIQDDCLTGVVYKYCEDTIKLIEEAIEKL